MTERSERIERAFLQAEEGEVVEPSTRATSAAPARRRQSAAAARAAIRKLSYSQRVAKLTDREWEVMELLYTVRVATRLQIARSLGDPLPFSWGDLDVRTLPSSLPVQPWLTADSKREADLLSESSLDETLARRRGAAQRRSNKRVLDLADLRMITIVHHQRSPGSSTDKALRVCGTFNPSGSPDPNVKLGRAADTIMLSSEGVRAIFEHLDVEGNITAYRTQLGAVQAHIAHSLMVTQLYCALAAWTGEGGVGRLVVTAFDPEHLWGPEVIKREGLERYKEQKAPSITDLWLQVRLMDAPEIAVAYAVECDRGTEPPRAIPAPGAGRTLETKIEGYYRLAARLGRPVQLAWVVGETSRTQASTRARQIRSVYDEVRAEQGAQRDAVELIWLTDSPTPTAWVSALALHLRTKRREQEARASAHAEEEAGDDA